MHSAKQHLLPLVHILMSLFKSPDEILFVQDAADEPCVWRVSHKGLIHLLYTSMLNEQEPLGAE